MEKRRIVGYLGLQMALYLKETSKIMKLMEKGSIHGVMGKYTLANG